MQPAILTSSKLYNSSIEECVSDKYRHSPFLSANAGNAFDQIVGFALVSSGGAAAIKIWGEKGDKKIWGGGKNVEMCVKHPTICHFYAEIVKFWLILTYLELFFGKSGRGQKIFGVEENAPNLGS